MQISRLKEVAKFACGFEALHAVFDANLWSSATKFTAFGITVTSPWDIVGDILNGAITLVLGLCEWSVWGASAWSRRFRSVRIQRKSPEMS